MIGGSVFTHALLLTGLLLAPTSPPATLADTEAVGVSLVDGRAIAALAFSGKASPPAPSKPAKPPVPRIAPTEIPPQYVDAAEPEIEVSERNPLSDPVSLAVAASGVKGQTCQLTVWLQQALQADPQVQAALLKIPRPARSVSNALMLWDGDWTDASPNAAAGIAAIRAAVLAGLSSAPESCRAQLVRGPELMTLTTGAETTVIALGSGEWRWGDLLPSAAPVSFLKAALPIR